MTSDHVEGLWDGNSVGSVLSPMIDPAQIDPDLREGAHRLGQSWMKRVVDILGASLGITVLAPILIMVCLLIILESPGSFLFTQRRTGFAGKPFVIFKFRTMSVAEDGPTINQAVRGDSRITNIGRILRRSSIDELPQLINVLKGEMSLVGPRPHALAHDAYYGSVISGYRQRFHTKPGLTGLAQVEGFRGETAEDSEMADRIERDLAYIRDWSLITDLNILFRTLLIFAFHPAAY